MIPIIVTHIEPPVTQRPSGLTGLQLAQDRLFLELTWGFYHFPLLPLVLTQPSFQLNML